MSHPGAGRVQRGRAARHPLLVLALYLGALVLPVVAGIALDRASRSRQMRFEEQFRPHLAAYVSMARLP